MEVEFIVKEIDTFDPSIPIFVCTSENRLEVSDLEEIEKSDNFVIVGTSALAAGINIPSLTEVVIHSSMQSIVDEVQVCGRAKRGSPFARIE